MPKKGAKVARTPTGGPRAFVVGGGLAGMTAAKILAENGVRVTILEASNRLGGKAGSTRDASEWQDHGFHCFPAWYVNTRALLTELGCDRNLVDRHRFHFLEKGAYPHFITTYEFNSPTNVLHNVFNGVLPWQDNLLSYYSLLELACEPLEENTYLDQISGTGFLRSRFYATEAVANLQQQTILQAAAIPAHECSALTLQRTFRAWLKWNTPLYSVLNGSLQEKFIGPFRDRLTQLGVEVRLRSPVDWVQFKGDRVRKLILKKKEEEIVIRPQDAVILATPREVVIGFGWSGAADYDTFERKYQSLLQPVALRSVPMSAVHFRLRRRLRDLPKEHVNLVGSFFGITFIDVSQSWEGLDQTTVNLVASRTLSTTETKGDELSEENLIDDILREFVQYVSGARYSDITDVYPQLHWDAPLFINTVDSWRFRPAAVTAITNLFRAGDYCQTEADLTTMESAVMSGINAAAASLKRAGQRAPAARRIGAPPLFLLSLLRYAALPVVAQVGLWKRARAHMETWTRTRRDA